MNMLATCQKPKYRLLADSLRSQMKSGSLKAGDRLPSLVQMYRDHGATQSTMRRVYELLEKEDLIERHAGSGIYVAHRSETKTKTGKLGLLLHTHSMTSSYMMEVLAGVRHEAARHGLEISLLDEDCTSIEPGKIDALIMSCHATEALAMELPSQLPHVLLFQHSPEFTCVVADDFEGAKMATHHLLNLGHQRVACLLSSEFGSVSRQRLAGYQAALHDAGITARNKDIRFLQYPSHQSYSKAGEQAMVAWLEGGWRDLGCSAILAHNDGAAIGVIKALTAAGLRVPKDVSVIGFDGTEISQLCLPRLTTIRIPLEVIGARAVKVLIAQMQEKVLQEEKVVLPVNLIMGETTMPYHQKIGAKILKGVNDNA